MSARYELKYMIRSEFKDYLCERWSRYLSKAPYTNELGHYPVLSQYYDTTHFLFYYEKLAGIGLRRKLRLRTYDYAFRPKQTAFLEIKQRVQNDKAIKTRKKFQTFQPLYLNPLEWPYPEEKDLAPFCALRDFHDLRQSAQVFYLREAYQGVIENGLRVTFDSSLVGLYPGETLTSDVLYDQSRNVLPETQLILEIKNSGVLPDWVHDLIQESELVQQPVPKYIMAVEALNLVDLQTGVYV